FVYDYKIDRPELWISFAKPLTVSTDNSFISRPKLLFTFLTTSSGHVIISAPTSSAWMTLMTSRQLAHNNFTPFLLCVTSAASFINGIGSTPVSAMRPANTNTSVGTSSVNELVSVLTITALHVIISAPTSSAWMTLMTSRQLAHNNFTPFLLCVTSAASFINGIGSTPVSAMRPANTDTYVGTPSVTALVISLT